MKWRIVVILSTLANGMLGARISTNVNNRDEMLQKETAGRIELLLGKLQLPLVS